MEHFISTEAYLLYIAVMAAIFVGGAIGIWGPYYAASKAAKQIEAYLSELKRVEETSERFHKFNKWIMENRNKYIKKTFKPSWEHYYKTYLSYRQQAVEFTPDIYDFFFEEVFVQNYGRRKLAEVYSGIFLSLGIVGTFFGIAVGMSSVKIGSGIGTDAMESGIGNLLQGMQVKFLSSIAGILLSLIWQVADKWRYYPSLTESFGQIRHALDDTFPTQDQSTLLHSIDKRQEEQMRDFQTFLSDQLIPKLASGVAESIERSIAPQMQQTQQLMSDLMQTSSANQAQGMQTMIDQFVTQLNDFTGDHMKNLGDALHSTVEWQQKVQQELESLVQSIQESAAGQSEMVAKTTGLTEQIHSYTESITDYQNVLEKTVVGLNETTEKNAELQSVTAELLGNMTEERIVFNDYFERHMSTLKENVEAIVSQTGLQVSFQQRLDENLQRIAGITQSQQTLAVTLSHQSELSQRSNAELEGIFDRFTQNNAEFVNLQGDLQELIRGVQQEREQLYEISSHVQEVLIEQVEHLDERVEQLASVWESNSSSLEKTNKHLETAMNQFTDDMHKGLQNTFTQFDQELTKSVSILASGVDAIQDGLIDLPDAMDTLKQTINEMNRQSKRMNIPVATE